MDLESLYDCSVFKFFDEINQIPRGSGNEKGISDYLVNFAKERNLEVVQDDVYNVVIYKKGRENSEPVILQGHMDMVCEKNSDVEHDFLKDPIKMIIDNNFISADGTTLGADNGIAVAMILAILDSDLEMPPIEGLFTVGEEVGMDGAIALDPQLICGKRLINIDNSEESDFITSCAGGVKCVISLPYEDDIVINTSNYNYKINVSGLKGGHSGMDINSNRSNSNIVMARILYSLSKSKNINIAEISGGAKDNAIPREAEVSFSTNEDATIDIKKIINTLTAEIKKVEENVKIECQEIKRADKVISKSKSLKIIETILLLPNGVTSMSSDIEGLVESSNNVGVVYMKDQKVSIMCAIRSSSESKKDLLKDKMSIMADLVGAELVTNGDYPGWEFNPNSEIRDKFCEMHKEIYGFSPKILAIHAGLECGILSKKIDGLDIISIGPDIYDLHTPDEKVNILSVERTYNLIKSTLVNL